MTTDDATAIASPRGSVSVSPHHIAAPARALTVEGGLQCWSAQNYEYSTESLVTRNEMETSGRGEGSFQTHVIQVHKSGFVFSDVSERLFYMCFFPGTLNPE